jgi:hypothetical protein
LVTLVGTQDKQTATTIGYSNPYDLGGGVTYVWHAGVTTTADGLTILGTNPAGRWIVSNDNLRYWTFPQIGALPGTNVGAAVNSAIALLYSIMDGGELHFHIPRATSTYNVETSILVPLVGPKLIRLKISGDGFDTGNDSYFGTDYLSGAGGVKGSVLKALEGIDAIQFTPSSTVGCYLHVENFAIVGSGTPVQQTGINMDPGYGGAVWASGRVGLYNLWTGINLRDAVSARDISGLVIRGCYIGVITGIAEYDIKSFEIQVCNYGMIVTDGYDASFVHGLYQSNIVDIVFGDRSGATGRSFKWDRIHFEGSGWSSPLRQNVDVAVTGPVSLNGIQTIDGQAGADGKLVLVDRQVDQLQNDIYRMHAGAWVREGCPFNAYNRTPRGKSVKVLTGSSRGTHSYKFDDSAGPGFGGLQTLYTLEETDGNPIRWRQDLGAGGFQNVVFTSCDWSTGGIISPYSGHLTLRNCDAKGVYVDPGEVTSGNACEVFLRDSSIAGFIDHQTTYIDSVGTDAKKISRRYYTTVNSASGAYSPNASNGDWFRFFLTGNLSIDTPVGYPEGADILYDFVQPAGGGVYVSINSPNPEVAQNTRGQGGSRRTVALRKFGSNQWNVTADTGWYNVDGAWVFYGYVVPVTTNKVAGSSEFQKNYETCWNNSTSSNFTWTLPLDSTYIVPTGWESKSLQSSTGTFTIAVEEGGTLICETSPTTTGPGSFLTVKKTAPNTWVVINNSIAKAISSLTIDQVVALGTWPLNTVYTTSGKSAVNDGGAVELICLTGTATVDNVNVYATLSDRHIRRRQYGLSAMARSTNLPASTTTDATAALENILNGPLRPRGSQLTVEQAYRITSTIHLNDDGSQAYFGKVIQGIPGQTSSLQKGGFYWDGASNVPMFECSAGDLIIKDLFIAVKTGVTADCLWNQIGAGHNQFHRVQWGAGTYYSGYYNYGFATDRYSIGVYNCEELRFDDCSWILYLEAANYFKAAQPFAMHYFRPSFGGNATGTVRGVCFDVVAGSCSLSVHSPTFSRVALAYRTASDQRITVSGMTDCEGLKRLAEIQTGTLDIGTGRYQIELTKDVATLSPTIAATDNRWLIAGINSKISLKGLGVSNNSLPFPDFQMQIQSSSSFYADELCGFPNASPLKVINNSLVGEPQGTIDIRAQGVVEPTLNSGLYYREIRSTGTRAGYGSEVVANTTTEVDVGFPIAETSAPDVSVSIIPESGTPSTGSLALPTWRYITERGFGLTLGAAPGAGSSVRVQWNTRVRRHTSYMAKAVETTFAADTLMATAVNGFSGSSSGCWWSFIVTTRAPDSSAATLIGQSDSYTGWFLQRSANQFTFSINGGAYGMSFSPSIANMVTGLFTSIITMVWTGTTLIAYVDGVQMTSDAAHAWVNNTSSRMRVGVNTQFGWQNSGKQVLHSATMGLGVPAASDVLYHARDTKQNNYLRSMLGTGVTTSHLYNFNGTGACTDEIGTTNFSLISGTAPLSAVVGKSWGF